MDWLWTLVGFFLTLLVFSYLFGDNPLFRLTSYIFIGVTSGYIAVLLVYEVLLPRLVWPFLQGGWPMILAIIPLVLAILLLAKLFPRLSPVGNISMAYLVGVGAAVMIGGAIMGTIIGQTRAAINLLPQSAPVNPLLLFLESLVLLIGTISTLIYFQFGVTHKPNQPPQRSRLVELTARVGQVFLAITLGALFAGVYGAAITALIDRLGFLQEVVKPLFF